MLGSVTVESSGKTRVAAVGRIVAYLLAAFIVWLCLGWAIDCYIAATAEDRFQTALRHGDFAAACINAGIAADAYNMAKDRRALEKWQILKHDFCPE